MATLSVGGQLVSTNDTLSNGVQDNITRLGAVTAGNLSNTAIVYPAGHIIQTVSKDTFTGFVDNSTEDYEPTGVELPITITSGNKVLILAHIWLAAWSGGNDVGTKFKLYDETNSNYLGNIVVPMYGHEGGGAAGIEIMSSVTQLYTPPTTTTNFEAHFMCGWGGTARVYRDRCTLTLIEVQT